MRTATLMPEWNVLNNERSMLASKQKLKCQANITISLQTQKSIADSDYLTTVNI